jgi:Family of unknown function (DUF5709)
MTEPDDQPQSADLGAAVQLDNAETLDGPAGGADALDAGYIPPDRPYGLDEDGVTAAGMREGDSIDDRLRREVPEDVAADSDRAGRLVPADSDADGMDAVDVGIDGGASSAEEAAVHVVGSGEEPAETEPVPSISDPEVDAEVESAAEEAEAYADAQQDLREDGEFTAP